MENGNGDVQTFVLQDLEEKVEEASDVGVLRDGMGAFTVEFANVVQCLETSANQSTCGRVDELRQVSCIVSTARRQSHLPS